MSVAIETEEEIETAEAIEAGQRFIKELQDIIDATQDVSGDSNDAMGHNGKRSAANDGINITRNILRRLGGLAIQPKKPEPAEKPVNEAPSEPAVMTLEARPSEAMLSKLEGVQEKLAEREPMLSFGKDFIQQELADGENIPAANQRLLEEFEELQQAKASLTPEQDERREHLRTAFYGFRG